MDFREYAANETSELAARLSAAATAAVEQAVQHVQDEAQKVADALRYDAQKVAEALRSDLRTAVEEKTATEKVLKDALVQNERVRTDLKATAERVEVASRQLDEASRTAEKLEASRTELAAARDEQAAARIAAETELRKTRETADALRVELASAMKTLEQAAAERMASEEAAAAANSHTQAAEAKLAAVTDLLTKSAGRVKALEQAQQEQQRKVQTLEAKLHEKPAPPPPGTAAGPILDELLAGFQAFSSASTISDVLMTLVEQLAAQYPRVALFRVKKGHLQGEHQIGFDLKTDIGKLVLPLGMDSLPARAVSSGQMETLKGEELKDSKRTPFSGSPSCAVALPIAVGGETLAIVYADDSGAPKSARGAAAEDIRARYAEAVQHYAVALLMRLTNELKALAELQKYAASLLNEMEQMYGADIDAGVQGDELQKRLAGNLDFARSIYGSRTALEGADAATLIEDELVALLEARKGTPFAHDLEVAIGHPRASAAEAS